MGFKVRGYTREVAQEKVRFEKFIASLPNIEKEILKRKIAKRR